MSSPKMYVSELAGCVAFPEIAVSVFAAGGTTALPMFCGWTFVSLG